MVSVHQQHAWTQCILTHSAFGKTSGTFLACGPLHHSQGRTYLALDDVQEEVGVTAAAQQVSKAQGLVEGLHLVQDVRGWPPRRASVCDGEH